MKWTTPFPALLLACAFAAPAHAQGTIKVSRSMELSGGAAKTWSAVKDFGGLHTWHPAVERTDIRKGGDNKPGTVRVLSLKGGGTITETLTGHSEPARTLSYRIDKSPLPVVGYNSTLAVKSRGTGSTITWSSTFSAKPGTKDDVAKKVIEGIYDAGFDNLKRQLGA